MTLYEHDGEARESDGHRFDADECLRNAMDWGMVPVTDERLSRAEWEATTNKCEHDRIDRHIITDYDGQGVHRDDMKWCPGAAVKGET